jgi:hypothetical protein
MAPALTLHHGAGEATFTEHPTEMARKALLAAAEIETPHLAAAMRRVAAALPDRPAIRRAVD